MFEVVASTQKLNTLVTFNYFNGQNPGGGLITDALGNLYGTTENGGSSGDGTVFEVAANTHVLSTLVTFNGTNGANPVGGLIADAAGNLYGTTQYGGSNGDGTVFEVAAGTDAINTLATFNGTNGEYPLVSLVADSFGNLYGTSFRGGSSNDGTVFELSNTGFVTAIPEPSVLGLLGIGCLVLLGRSRNCQSGNWMATETFGSKSLPAVDY